MNLNQLKIFYMAAKLENLSLAGEKLNITQPAVTKGIQRLQEFCEIKLVNRFGKKLVLTDAGRSLYRIAEKIFDLETLAEENVRDFQLLKAGHIKILTSESFGAYYLPEIIIPFSHEHPSVRISVEVLPTNLVVDDVANLKCDLGFTSYLAKDDKVQMSEILEDQLVFIAPPDHPLVHKDILTSVELSGQSMIVHERGSVPARALMDFLKEYQISVNIQLELSSNRAILRAVESGLGIALVNLLVAQEKIETGTVCLLPLPNRILTRKFYMAHHKDKYISALLQQFIDQVNNWALSYVNSLPED